MKKKYFSVLFLFLFTGINSTAFSQVEYLLKQVIIVNGGVFETDDPTDYVTVSSYDPIMGNTRVFDTIYTQSTQCVIVENGVAYVAAQDSIIKYDLDTYQRMAEVKVNGVNQLKIYNNYLIVGRQYPATNKYVKVYHKNDLSEIASFDDISGDTYGITVDNDTAFIAVNGGWMSTSGSLVKIYLGNDVPEFVEEMPLGEQALGIAQLFNNNNIIYSVNKSPWGGTTGSFTEYHTLTGQVSSTTIDFTVGNGISLAESELYVMLNGNIGAFNVDTKEITSTIVADANDSLDILSAVYDEKTGWFFVNFSSYINEGQGKVYDLSGMELSNYDVGISAEAIALDYRILGSITNKSFKDILVITYPNPTSEFVSVKTDAIIKNIGIYDLAGKQISVIQHINATYASIITSEMANGIYIFRIETESGTISKRIVKQ